MVLELTDKEKRELKTVLTSYEKELRGEILKTDDRKLRSVLHGEEGVVMGLLNKVA